MENKSQGTENISPEVLPLAETFQLTPRALAFASLSLAAVLLAVFLFVRRTSKSRGSALLLVGPPESGKTAIFSTIVYDHTLPTSTSLQTNASVIALPPSSKTIRIVDVPGHPRIRDQFRDHLPDAKAISFVADASTISRNGAAVAEHLHHILDALTSLPPSQALPSLFIVAHKIDLLKSGASSGKPEELAVSRVKAVLERELEKRRASQSGGVGVEGLGEEGERSDMGGLECSGPSGGAFKFAEWEGGEVDFIGTWVKAAQIDFDEKHGKDGLGPLREYLNQLS